MRRKYTYDRNSNRLSIEHVLYPTNSQSATLDDLNRLTEVNQGFLNASDEVYASGIGEVYNMDLLGNFSGTDGIEINGVPESMVHEVNETNEISSIDYHSASGDPKIISDAFTTLNGFWTEDTGEWSASGELSVDSLDSGEAILLADADVDMLSYVFDVAFPTSSSTNKAGLLYAYDASTDNGYAVVIDRDAEKLSLHQISSGSFGSALASDDVTISDETPYTVRVMQRQRTIRASVDGQSCSFSYTGTTDFKTGNCGLYSDKADVTFDDFSAYEITARDSKCPRIVGAAQASVPEGYYYLLVEDSDYRADAVVQNFSDDDYMVQVDMDLNSGTYGDVWVRYIDANNGYMIRVDDDSDSTVLYLWENGYYSTLATSSATFTTDPAIKVKVDGSSIKVWEDGQLGIDTTDSTFEAGGVAFSGDQAKFDNLMIGYDNNDDDDIDDARDDVVMNQNFGSRDASFTYDQAGNMIDDGTFVYIYDAWNRLVKVRASDASDITIQEAEFDGMGRRIRKTVTNSGGNDGTRVYLYDGLKIIETRDGHNDLVQQFIHGNEYIDELVMIRVAEKGDLYVHQDANWNVIALTDLGGHVVERYLYKPYGEMIVNQETSFGDYDGDQDVDTTDRDAYSGSSPSGAERILDLDFDDDVDGTDTTLFNSNLVTGISRHPGRISTGVEQPFGHQGLLFDSEITSYQNRRRQFAPQLRKFIQRDPIDYSDGMNLYEYCGSNPLNRVDSSGLKHILSIRSSAVPMVKIEYNNFLIVPPDWDMYTFGVVAEKKKDKWNESVTKHGVKNPNGTTKKPCYFKWYFKFNFVPDNPIDVGWNYWHNTVYPDDYPPPPYPNTPTWYWDPNITSISYPPFDPIKYPLYPEGSSEPTLWITLTLDIGEENVILFKVFPDTSQAGVGGSFLMRFTFSCLVPTDLEPSIR